ncbi:MAG: Crp/Fnr family transcriptional regulator [Gracilimonas sp.]|uniref:Crp/Fnr family transcriptional regulator n=1 Tax=Gracilimonas sp. TaxID=1974203 RepID=UPI0019BA43EE|nr:Crp/Fnr family transcriptional regulator [Gracilimonas sp.]MBD3615036.1 Crp/Fnr family transcriptional regulator [Gracilimonas sp.]
MNQLLPNANALSELGITKTFQTGDEIVSEDAPVRSIPIVIKGSLKVMQSDDDYREMVLYYLQPGDTCVMSFLAALYNDTSKVKAIAEEETEVVFITIEKVRELMSKDPKWLNYVFQIYHKRFEELLGVVNAIAFKKMDERLLQFLQKKAKVSGSKDIKITHEQLAQELGTAREVISRLLKQMETEGLVELGRNRISLTEHP